MRSSSGRCGRACPGSHPACLFLVHAASPARVGPPAPSSLVWGPPCPWHWGAVPRVASGGAACSLRSGEAAWGVPGSNRESPHLGALLFLGAWPAPIPAVSTEKAPLLRNLLLHQLSYQLTSASRHHAGSIRHSPLCSPPHPDPAGPCRCRLTLRPPPPPPSCPQS